MRSFLIENLGENTVLVLNAIAQVLTFVLGAVGYYELRTYRLISATLNLLAAVRKYITVGLFYAGVTFDEHGQRHVKGELSPLGYCLISIGILALIIVTGRGPLTVLSYCWSHLWNVGAVWGDLSLCWSALVIPLKSVFYLIWAWLVFLLLVMGLAILVKTCSLVCEAVRNRLNENAFKFVLFFAFLVSGTLLLLTSIG